MRIHSKRTVALVPALLLPLSVLVAPNLGCELLVNDVDLMLVDGSPVDVVIPMTLDGYTCKICTDIPPDADLDGDLYFPEAGAKDATGDGPGDAGAVPDGGAHDASAEGSSHDAGSG